MARRGSHTWLAPAALLWHCCATLAWPALRFSEDGTFQIAIFADLHFGEAEDTDWGPRQDAGTLGVMRTVLGRECPQLVVLNGDLVAGEATLRENATDYVDAIVAPMVEAGLPWASTYGNHDSDFNLSRVDLYKREKRYENSLTGRAVFGNDSGISNYYLPVYTAQDTTGTPAMLLWFFDSRGGKQFQTPRSNPSAGDLPNWVGSSAVAWFERTRDNLTATHGKAIPSLAFFHIPVDAAAALQAAGLDATTAPGINADVPLAQQGAPAAAGGGRGRGGGPDGPFTRALQATDGLAAAFSGHDHGNDWCVRLGPGAPPPPPAAGDTGGVGGGGSGHGLQHLCFGRHTGYGGYGNWTRGSRQVLVRLDALGRATETWNRLEDGSVVGNVTLNATYGTDVYPAVPLTYTSIDDKVDMQLR